MAKAVARCTCKMCGDSFTKENTFRSRKEADSWEEWAESNFDLCNKCYAKQQKELEIQKGLYVDIKLDIQSVYHKDEYPIAIIFGGDTMPHKDAIKALGAIWTTDYPADGALADLFGMRKSIYRWVLWCKIDDIQDKIDQAIDLGANVNSTPKDIDFALYRQIKNQMDKERDIKKEKVQLQLDELGSIPAWPEEISKLWPNGAKWNGKFYGRSGRWCVYLSGEKVDLTDEEKKGMEEAALKRSEWRKKKNAIENGN